MMKYTTTEIENYVNGLTDFQQEIVNKIRETVLSVNGMKEAIKWGSVAFYNKQNICGFRVAKAHVTLLFMEGKSLNDINGILAGTGAKARTYKIKTADEINVQAVTNLVEQALAQGM